MFSNHFITDFPQNAPVKKKLTIGQYLTKIAYGQNFVAYFFWATLYVKERLVTCNEEDTDG